MGKGSEFLTRISQKLIMYKFFAQSFTLTHISFFKYFSLFFIEFYIYIYERGEMMESLFLI